MYPFPTRPEIVSLVRPGIELRNIPEIPFLLASGNQSFEYADVKAALCTGPSILTVAHYAISQILALKKEFNVVGGPTMGADFFASGIAIARSCRFFSVAKPGQPYTRYSEEGQVITGARFEPGDRIVAAEDTVSTGSSLLEAIDRIDMYCQERDIPDVEVVAGITVLDRGNRAKELFADRNLAYIALTTYEDFNLAPVS